jgi:hypothetical protein
MSNVKWSPGTGLAGWLCACALASNVLAYGQTPPKPGPEQSQPQQNRAQPSGSPTSDDSPTIEPADLPTTYPYGQYRILFRLRGDVVQPLHWMVWQGTLPPGIVLDESGDLHGAAERPGEFRFKLSVRDSGSPQRGATRDYVINVVEALSLVWKTPAHVTGNRIDGSVAVSNTTNYDIDLTFDVKAVAEDGRATEIGYQHFPLKRGTTGMTLPFGETLPHGAYLVRIDVVGEVARHQAIYRQSLQAPGRLQVLVGP